MKRDKGPVKMPWFRGSQPAQWWGTPSTDAPQPNQGTPQGEHFKLWGVSYPIYAMLFDIKTESIVAWEARMRAAHHGMKRLVEKGE